MVNTHEIDLGLIGSRLARKLVGREIGVSRCSILLDGDVLPSTELTGGAILGVSEYGIFLSGYSVSKLGIENQGGDGFLLIPWGQVLTIELSPTDFAKQKDRTLASSQGISLMTEKGTIESERAKVRERLEELCRTHLPGIGHLSQTIFASQVVEAALRLGCHPMVVKHALGIGPSNSQSEIVFEDIVERLMEIGFWRPGSLPGWGIEGIEDPDFWVAVLAGLGHINLNRKT